MLTILIASLLAVSTRPPTIESGQTPKLEFEVASVRQNNFSAPPSGNATTSNVPLGPGDLFAPTGGELNAKNFSLMQYVAFAYKMSDGQVKAFQQMAPEWVTTDRFNIQARTENHEVTKDQLRLMMRSLLAERFKMAVHEEMRQEAVFRLMPVKPGTTGPKLRMHPARDTCSSDFSPREGVRDAPEALAEGFPTICGGLVGMTASAADRFRIGARNVPMRQIAASMAGWGNLGRAVVDETGFVGKYDFVLEYTPESLAGSTQDSGGSTFQDAVKKQLGLRFEAETEAVPVLRLDHIERLTEN